MQVLETIQEYTPIRHGLSYLSAWITKGHNTYGDPEEHDLHSETRLNGDEAAEGASSRATDGCLDVDETQYGTPVGTSFDLGLGLTPDPTQKTGDQLSSPPGSHDQDGPSCGFTAEATVSENTTDYAQSQPRLSSTPAHCANFKADYRTPDILLNDLHLPQGDLECISRDGQDMLSVQESITRDDVADLQGAHVTMDRNGFIGDDPLNVVGILADTDPSFPSSSRTLPKENGVLCMKGYKGKARDYDASRRYPTLLKAWQKRQIKARRQKASTSVEGRLVFRRYRLPDSVSELGTLRQYSRSKSESDIDGAVSASRVGEISGDSDQSAQSLNVLHDNTDDYVDIDFYRRGSYSGSSCRDTSASSGSLDLSSDWTEFTLSVSEHSVGEECRESDQQDTESCRSQDLSSNLNSQRVRHKRWRKRFLHGQAVNEFVDKECFCCHCVIL